MERTTSATINALISSIATDTPPDFDAADDMAMLPEADFDLPGQAELQVLGVPLTATALFKLCCGNGDRPLDPDQLRAAQPHEWNETNRSGAVPLHALCANTNLTFEAFRAAADSAPAEAWGRCTVHGANPLHRLLGNERVTFHMLELVAGKVPAEAWHTLNKFGTTPAHRLCSNSIAISAQMLRLAGRHAPAKTWKTKNLKNPKGKGGGLTPLDLLFARRMAEARTPDIIREAAALMDGGRTGGGGGGTGSGVGGGGGLIRGPVRSLSGGSVGGAASPTAGASSSSGGGGGGGGNSRSRAGPTTTVDWKLQAAKHFFSLGASGGAGLGTALAPPIITRYPQDIACVRLRGWVDGNTKGDCLSGCTKGTVFAEAKFTVATVLDGFKDSRRSVKDSSGA